MDIIKHNGALAKLTSDFGCLMTVLFRRLLILRAKVKKYEKMKNVRKFQEACTKIEELEAVGRRLFLKTFLYTTSCRRIPKPVVISDILGDRVRDVPLANLHLELYRPSMH